MFKLSVNYECNVLIKIITINQSRNIRIGLLYSANICYSVRGKIFSVSELNAAESLKTHYNTDLQNYWVSGICRGESLLSESWCSNASNSASVKEDRQGEYGMALSSTHVPSLFRCSPLSTFRLTIRQYILVIVLAVSTFRNFTGADLIIKSEI